MQLLRDVDVDEVSPVRRGANRKKVVLKADKGVHVEAEIADIMAVPWEREGAMIDELRKEGADESVLKAAVGAMRLLSGIRDDLPPDMRVAVEKLGREMYPILNTPLNTGHGSASGGLVGSASGDEDLDAASDMQTGEDGVGNIEAFEGGGLEGSGAGKKVSADTNDDDPDVDKADKPYGNVTYADPGYQADKKARYPIDTEEHIRAAWSYINKPSNAAKYSSGDLAKVKAKIKAAMSRIGADVAKEDAVVEETRRFADFITKAFGRKAKEETPEDEEPDEDPDDTNDAVEKGGTVETHAVPIQKEDGSWDLSGVPEDARPFYTAMITKADETAVALEKAEGELAETREQLRTAEIIAKAETEFQNVGARDDIVEVLKSASEKLSPEAYEKLVTVLSAANERISTGDLFKEAGVTGGIDGSDTDAWAKIEKAADDLVEKASDGLSQAQAIERVLRTPEGAALYSAYVRETGMGVS